MCIRSKAAEEFGLDFLATHLQNNTEAMAYGTFGGSFSRPPISASSSLRATVDSVGCGLNNFRGSSCLNAQPKPARHCSLTLYFDSTTKNMTALIWRGQILEAGGSARRLARLLQPGTIARRSISSAVPSKGPWQSFVRLARSGRII